MTYYEPLSTSVHRHRDDINHYLGLLYFIASRIRLNRLVLPIWTLKGIKPLIAMVHRREADQEACGKRYRRTSKKMRGRTLILVVCPTSCNN